MEESFVAFTGAAAGASDSEEEEGVLATANAVVEPAAGESERADVDGVIATTGSAAAGASD